MTHTVLSKWCQKKEVFGLKLEHVARSCEAFPFSGLLPRLSSDHPNILDTCLCPHVSSPSYVPMLMFCSSKLLWRFGSNALDHSSSGNTKRISRSIHTSHKLHSGRIQKRISNRISVHTEEKNFQSEIVVCATGKNRVCQARQDQGDKVCPVVLEI